MTDELQIARARKHSPGFAEYLEARAELDAKNAETAPPPTPRTLADRTATLPLDERLERVRRGLAGEVQPEEVNG